LFLFTLIIIIIEIELMIKEIVTLFRIDKSIILYFYFFTKWIYKIFI